MVLGDLPAPFDPSAADLTPVARASYLEALTAEWKRLIGDPLFTDEANIQRFLERHPSLVPGAFGPSMRSGHTPWPAAVVTQPELPDLSTKRPDFMWISTDSAFLRPVLVEIERPDKRWFHENGAEQHADLTTPLTQVAHWRSWFNTAGNHTAFLRHYRIPRVLMDRPIEPHFIVVHGRRDEATGSPARQRLRASISAAHSTDTILMTFDALSPDGNALDFGTVHLERDGLIKAVSVPATFAFSEGDRDRAQGIEGLEHAIDSSPDLSPTRKTELKAVLSELRGARPLGLRASVARRR